MPRQNPRFGLGDSHHDTAQSDLMSQTRMDPLGDVINSRFGGLRNASHTVPQSKVFPERSRTHELKHTEFEMRLLERQQQQPIWKKYTVGIE